MAHPSGTTLAEPPQTPASPTPASYTAPAAAPQAIAVDIYDQIYNLRGIDPDYIERLAHIVDAKMRAVSAHGNTVDSLRVAVLAALNIADELEALRERYDALAGSVSQSQHSLRSRAGALTHMLDEVLVEPGTRRAG